MSIETMQWSPISNVNSRLPHLGMVELLAAWREIPWAWNSLSLLVAGKTLTSDLKNAKNLICRGLSICSSVGKKDRAR